MYRRFSRKSCWHSSISSAAASQLPQGHRRARSRRRRRGPAAAPARRPARAGRRPPLLKIVILPSRLPWSFCALPPIWLRISLMSRQVSTTLASRRCGARSLGSGRMRTIYGCQASPSHLLDLTPHGSPTEPTLERGKPARGQEVSADGVGELPESVEVLLLPVRQVSIESHGLRHRQLGRVCSGHMAESVDRQTGKLVNDLTAEKRGRDGGIRTRDPLNPIQVRYQAAPRPDRVTSTARGSLPARGVSA
jgi:hypothetical protein